MGCVPGLMVNPACTISARKYRVDSSSLSRNAVDAEIISMALSEAATTHGATVLENR